MQSTDHYRFQRIEDNEDWDRFLQLAGEDKYTARIAEWARISSETNKEISLDPNSFFTTSIIAVE